MASGRNRKKEFFYVQKIVRTRIIPIYKIFNQKNLNDLNENDSSGSITTKNAKTKIILI